MLRQRVHRDDEVRVVLAPSPPYPQRIEPSVGSVPCVVRAVRAHALSEAARASEPVLQVERRHQGREGGCKVARAPEHVWVLGGEAVGRDKLVEGEGAILRPHVNDGHVQSARRLPLLRADTPTSGREDGIVQRLQSTA